MYCRKKVYYALFTVAFMLIALQSAVNADLVAPNCGTQNALSTCSQLKSEFLVPEKNNGESRYVAASVRYFLTMKSNQKDNTAIATESDQRVKDYKRPLEKGEWNPINKWFSKTTVHPRYAPLVVRYEFPPWLLTTGYGEKTMRNVDELLRIYETDYQKIDCEYFDTQPFARCHVVFLYGKDDPGTPEDERTECPIYEEFTFNDQGQITFIEAWTDEDGFLPMEPGDYWAEGPNVKRLSTYIPGLGTPTGKINPASKEMARAAVNFDDDFEAEYWDWKALGTGPFESMINDINGRFSFWPNWLKRLMDHSDKNFLDGCKPPED